MPLISDMINFVKRSSTSRFLKPAEMIVGGYTLRTISMNIIKWLSLEYTRELRRINSQRLKLDYNEDWCKGLRKLVDCNSIFSRVFEIEDDFLYYNRNIDEFQWKEVRRETFNQEMQWTISDLQEQ